MDNKNNIFLNFIKGRPKIQLVSDTVIAILLIGSSLIYKFKFYGEENCQNYFPLKVSLFLALAIYSSLLIYQLKNRLWKDALSIFLTIIVFSACYISLDHVNNTCVNSTIKISTSDQ